MDNPLTPNKIRRLIHLAEDKSFNLSRRLLLNDDEIKRIQANQAQSSKSTMNCESSSGILDLDQVEAFGESILGTESLSKSTAFNPGEMTGRSTGADEINRTMPLGRHSFTMDSLSRQMDKQTNEIQDLMRHSISNTTTNSFHSKRDLTADEASLVMREAPLPIQPSNIQAHFNDSMSMNHSTVSVGAYFQSKCPEFGKMLGKTDSPDRSGHPGMPSISEMTLEQPSQVPPKYTMDESLDCVPVRQPRLNKLPDKLNLNNPTMVKNCEKQSFHSTANKFEKNNDTYNKASEHDYSSISRVPESRQYEQSQYVSKQEKNNDTYNKASELNYGKVPEPQQYIPMTLNPIASSSFASHKPLLHNMPADALIRKLHSSSIAIVSDDTGASACPSDTSLTISKIADYLERESNISVSDILKLNNQKKPLLRNQLLTGTHTHESKSGEMHVTNLRDTKKMDTASSSGTMNTVISLDKLKISEEKAVPSIVVTNYLGKEEVEEYIDRKRCTRSKSPSSKSQSTLSTVQENFTSFKSDSPLQTSKGDVTNTHVPSPNIEYRELDKSVDWHDVLQQKRVKQQGLAKEQWADILTSAAKGFVGVSCPITITITNLTDSWLSTKLQFDDLPNDGKDITIEIPRLPYLLSPGKSEQVTINITSYIEMDTTLQYTVFLKDASIDIEQKETVDVHIKMPIIQAMSCDGVNKVTFPVVQEKTSLLKSFVLISDCPVDLQLDLSVVEGDSVFSIKNVQEIKKADVNKVLTDRQGYLEEGHQVKAKNKGLKKQLCILSSGNAIRVTIQFSAPKLAELQIEANLATFDGALTVNVIGVNTILRKVELVATVGTVNLVVKTTGSKLLLTNEPSNLTVCNTGSIAGGWIVKFANQLELPFKVAPSRFDIRPLDCKQISLCYTGPKDNLCETTLIFEDVSSGNKTAIEIAGGENKPKSFPIKTNNNIISFVRSGRKELSLKNSTDKKVQIRCHIDGEGFSIDLPGLESKGTYCLSFGPSERRPLPILFNPVLNVPYKANLHLAFDKNSEFSRNVKLFGCPSGKSMRWAGLVTYGETTLVRAVCREPIKLELYNKCPMPAFVCARVHFNVQYTGVAPTARLAGGACVVAARARHALALHVEWARVEARARDAATAALATVTVLTGAELTRRRILKVLRDEASGAPDTSLLDDHLKVLAEKLEGEDPNIEDMLANFNETKASSLNELIGSLHELTAQIVLPQDFVDEHTIIISDETVLEHHTLCD